MTYWQKDDLKFFATFAAALVLLVAVVAYAGAKFDRATCFARWDGSGMSVQWTVAGGCRVRVGERWIPAENFRP